MAPKIRISIKPEPSSLVENITCTVYFDDPKMIGRIAKLTVETNVLIDKKHPINRKKIHFSKKITINAASMHFEIQKKYLPYYHYQGAEIKIISSINVALFSRKNFISKAEIVVTRELVNKLQKLENNRADTKSVKSNIFKRILALPGAERRSLKKKLLLIASILLLLLLLTIHDLWVGAELSYLYEIYDESRNVVIAWVSFVVIFVITVYTGITLELMLSQWLRISLNKKQIPRRFNKETRCLVADLCKGKTTTYVKNMLVRVIAYNVERGKYIVESKSKKRNVKVSHFINENILFEKKLSQIPKDAKLGPYLQDTVNFEKVFEKMYPPNMLSKNYGLDIQLEVQFIHKGFDDQYIILPSNKINYSHFFSL